MATSQQPEPDNQNSWFVADGISNIFKVPDISAWQEFPKVLVIF